MINFDPPEDQKGYVHRVGRTGRAGRSGTGVTLVLPEQQADVSHVARLLGHTEQFVQEGLKVAPARLVYTSRGRRSKWGPPAPPQDLARLHQGPSNSLLLGPIRFQRPAAAAK